MKQSKTGREFEFYDEDFKLITKLVTQYTGIVLPDHKRDMVYSRLARRLRALNLKTFKEYCTFLEHGDSEQELVHFVNAITTKLTGFFREGHHFDHLKGLLEDFSSKAENKRLRIWSSASSSGPEPYSIAMVVNKVFDGKPNWDVKILATDIDTNMLDQCQLGEYPDDALEKIPAEYKSCVQINNNGTIQMPDKLKKLISFKQLNLLKDWPMRGQFDIIFCRNVVIYFDKETQRRLFDRMADILTPDGLLYIGHSENLFNVCDRFKSIGRTIYQRIK